MVFVWAFSLEKVVEIHKGMYSYTKFLHDKLTKKLPYYAKYLFRNICIQINNAKNRFALFTGLIHFTRN